jgi:hypothetical protein
MQRATLGALFPAALCGCCTLQEMRDGTVELIRASTVNFGRERKVISSAI